MEATETPLPELDNLSADELRALVRAYHATLQAVIHDNNAWNAALEKGQQIWSGQVNSRLAALFETFNPTKDRTDLQ